MYNECDMYKKKQEQLTAWLTTSPSPPEAILSPCPDICLSDNTFNLLQHPGAGLRLPTFQSAFVYLHV